MSDLGPDDPMAPSWWQVRCTVTPESADLAADALWQHGAAGVEELDAGGGVMLVGGFASKATAEGAAETLRTDGHRSDVTPVLDDGLDAWRAHARAVPAGSFVLVPAWLEAPEGAPPERTVHLDPGRAFGSGSHPTTRLVVADLEGLVRPGHRVLDVGCGSGVLAIVAARLGARLAVGVDIDPAALEATQVNAQRNGVAEQVTTDDRGLAALAADATAGVGVGRFDVVAANLLAPIVAELATELRAVVAPGGALVVAGILTTRWRATAAVLAPLQVVAHQEQDGWSSLVLRDRASPR
jgi:ribosomal protein L11 methyltransferase